MDPITILSTAIPLAMKAWQMAKDAGIVGKPAWAAYADEGMGILKKATDIAEEIKSGSTDYDHLTADEIETLLKPLTWEEIEATAKGGA